jgi:hypothetical protein
MWRSPLQVVASAVGVTDFRAGPVMACLLQQVERERSDFLVLVAQRLGRMLQEWFPVPLDRDQNVEERLPLPAVKRRAF